MKKDNIKYFVGIVVLCTIMSILYLTALVYLGDKLPYEQLRQEEQDMVEELQKEKFNQIDVLVFEEIQYQTYVEDMMPITSTIYSRCNIIIGDSSHLINIIPEEKSLRPILSEILGEKALIPTTLSPKFELACDLDNYTEARAIKFLMRNKRNFVFMRKDPKGYTLITFHDVLN